MERRLSDRNRLYECEHMVFNPWTVGGIRAASQVDREFRLSRLAAGKLDAEHDDP